MRQDNLDIAEWIRYAKGNYDAARKMAEQFQPVPLEIVCYHCQQSAEKILKAYILANGDELIKTHDIYTLLERCKSFNPDFEKLVKTGADLSDYVALSRYPAFDTITIEDMEQALVAAKSILDFTIGQIRQ